MRYEFYKDSIIYVSAIPGKAFASIHKMNGMSREDAKKAFHREHQREILIMLQDENKSIEIDQRIIRSLN
jgi:hypothetical protein